MRRVLHEGRTPDVAAPEVAKYYWKLPAGATLRDVVCVVRADEAHHRDVNHGHASMLTGDTLDLLSLAPYPEHAEKIRRANQP